MAENTIKISIIIPIHNAKDFISRCLDSLLNQTLKELEIICVLDCPTDGTDRIVKSYSRRDSRVVVLQNTVNLHTSKSRNRGLQIARGEYIGFHDHDDYNNDVHMYEDLYREAKKENADAVLSDAICIYHDTGRGEELWRIKDIDKDALIVSNIQPMLKTINQQPLTHCVWSSIYKRDFLEHNAIAFKDRSTYLDEDRLFNFEVYYKATRISYVPKARYVWEESDNHISGTPPSYIASAQITRTQFYVDYLKSNNGFDKYKKNIWQLLAVETKIYWKYYVQLNKIEMHRLCQLMRDMQYPIWGYKYGLKLFSKKRLMLVWFNIRVRLS